jgi:CheY-like chemotaxis protein
MGRLMLKRAKILIVEDEAMIATHLVVLVEDHNGEVVGLAASVAEALEMLAEGIEVDGAVLDGNLGDGGCDAGRSAAGGRLSPGRDLLRGRCST